MNKKIKIEVSHFLERFFDKCIKNNINLYDIHYITEEKCTMIINLNDYKIIYLDASYACLKKNYETREKKCISDDEFQERINGGNKMGLTILKEYVLRNLKNNCLYYYKNGNEDLDYINIFDEISKRKSEKKI